MKKLKIFSGNEFKFFTELLEKNIDAELEKTLSEGELAEELAELYFELLNTVFPDFYDVKLDKNEPRLVVVDGNAYDLSTVKALCKSDLKEHLYEIDALFSDVLLISENRANVIAEIEKKILKKKKD